MSLKERLLKLIGIPETISESERWRRAVVRTGNHDWRGLPIDQNPGRPIARRSGPYSERVADFLSRAGMKIERRNEHVPQLIPDRIFDREIGITEQAHERRFDAPESKYRDNSIDDFLQHGAARPPRR